MYHDIKKYGGVEVQHHGFLTSTLQHAAQAGICEMQKNLVQNHDGNRALEKAMYR